MADFAYAVHTDVCTYLLDETGVCLWVLSPAHSTATAVKSCVGAHFVACVDTRVAGGLVGELTEGAAALFVSVNKETGRPSLLRTGIIRRVQERHPSQVQALLEPLLEDIDVHFEDEVSQRQTVASPIPSGARPAPPIASRESEATTRVFEMPSAKTTSPELAGRDSQDLSGLDRPTEPRNSPLAEAAAASPDQRPSPAELPVAQPPPCPDLPEPQAPPVVDLPKAAPTLVIDLPKETSPQQDTADKPRAHGPPPLPKPVAHTPLPAPLPPPLPSGSMGHTPLPAPLPPPLPSGSMGHTPVPAPLPVAHTPAPPPLPKSALPPLPGQLTHTPLPPPLPKNPAHTPGPPPLPAQDRSPVPPPVWLTHAALPELSPPALPLPPVVVGIDESDTETSKDLSKEEGAKPGGSRLPKRKSSTDNSVSPPTLSSQRTRGSQPGSRAPKQAAGKKVPPPPLPPPPRSIAGARSSAFDENAPLPLRRRKKKD